MVDVGREACKIRRVEACPISYSKKGFALWPIPFSGVESEKCGSRAWWVFKCMIGRLLQRCRRELDELRDFHGVSDSGRQRVTEGAVYHDCDSWA